MDAPGYSVTTEAGYIFLHFRRVLEHAEFDDMADHFIRLLQRGNLKKLLFLTEVDFDQVDSARRMEGRRMAEYFAHFDKIAVVATDPRELTYLKTSTSLLIMSGIIKNPANFRHFAELGKAKRWIEK